jgi:hypothetical protein
VNELDLLPWPAPGAEWPEYLPLPLHAFESGNLEVSLVTPETVMVGAEFEYAVWRTPSMTSFTEPSPVVEGTAEFGLHGSGTETWTTLSLPLGLAGLNYPDRYTLVVRRVNAAAQSPALLLTFYSRADDEVYVSDWNVLTSGDLEVDGPEPGDGGGSGQGAGPPPPPPVP